MQKYRPTKCIVKSARLDESSLAEEKIKLTSVIEVKKSVFRGGGEERNIKMR